MGRDKRNFPVLYAIANVDSHSDPKYVISSMLTAGIQLLQIRAKHLPRETIRELGIFALAEAKRSGRSFALPAKIIINDDSALAAEIDADGVHLGQGDGSVEDARKLLGPDKIIGLSTHSLFQVEAAEATNGGGLIDYLGFGPIFPSPTKQGHAAVVGLSGLEKAAKLTALPIYAIGGVSFKSAEDILKCGATGVAVISELESALKEGTQALTNIIENYNNLRVHKADA